MAQEEYISGRCHSGGSGRSKKTKQKKAPQRGLGVAQLEKIISEEKQKKGYFGKNIDSDTHVSPFSGLHPNFSQGREIWAQSYNNNDNNNNNFRGMSHNLIAFEPQLNGQILAQRSHQFQRPSCSSTLVKSSSGISAVMSTQMEPPSIPSFHYKNYALTEEDKMIGMMKKKRAYPFSLDHSKSDELASSFTNDQQQYTIYMEPRNKLIRESVSNPGPPERNLNELPNGDSERLNGSFLTLAPPAVASPPLKPVHKHALDYLGHPRHESSDNQCIPGQEYGNKSQLDRAWPSGSGGNSFSFFPIELRTNQNTAYVSGGDGRKGETIDLNLKL